MTPPAELPDLERRRDRLRTELLAVGDFRPGSLNQVMRRCGRPNCACADPDHPGHGPQHVLTRKLGGKTATVHLRPGPELEKARTEVGNYQRFRQIMAEFVEVNEAICRARPASPLAGDTGRQPDEAQAGTPGQKGGSSARSRSSSPPRSPD